MPRYSIRLINSEFESFDEAEYASLGDAVQTAIATATRVVAESISEGEPTAAVELQIREGEHLVARHVVTLSVSDLSGGQSVDEAAADD
jgi:hypothetical protein